VGPGVEVQAHEQRIRERENPLSAATEPDPWHKVELQNENSGGLRERQAVGRADQKIKPHDTREISSGKTSQENMSRSMPDSVEPRARNWRHKNLK
jgi:hypothetical protein